MDPFNNDNFNGNEIAHEKMFGVLFVFCFGILIPVFSCYLLENRLQRRNSLRREMENLEPEEQEPPPYSISKV